MTWKEVQTALAAAGFHPGPVDGIPGRATRAAVVRFQRSRGLEPDGIVGPKTLRALGAVTPSKGPAIEPPPAWYEIAKAKLGLHESRNNTSLLAWLRSDGRTLGDPSRLPWCGDFVETCLALSLPDEILPGNPYLARNWLKAGVGIEGPALGAIAVFWRGTKSGTSGHVGFYAGEDATHIHVLGGNQSNAVTIARIHRDRLLGLRWPATRPRPPIRPVLRPASGTVTTNEA
jgi:uncharacterized protein (TIGR02594 family)